jgi:hypothetical protein
MSSQAFERDWKPAHGSGEAIDGVSACSGSRVSEVAVDCAVSVSIGDSSSISGSGGGLGAFASANTRVGFGALPSHGKIGLGLVTSAGFGFGGNWYHMSLGASG